MTTKTKKKQSSFEYLVDIQNLRKSYLGKNPVFSKAVLQIKQKEFLFLTGVSGAGKTTIFKLILGLEAPEEGQIYFQGKDVVTLSQKQLPYHRRQIGAVFQDYKLLPSRSVAENIAVPLQIAGVSKMVINERIRRIAKEMEIEPLLNQKILSISGGEQQLTAIARASITFPPLILADEPTANLDRTMANKVLNTLKKINSKGTTVIVATHDVHLIKSMASKIYFIKNANIVEIQQKEATQ